jgi:cytosine/adenosine deaminase-related metal-dependent hydrolase
LGLAPHALFTASANLYRRCEEFARHRNILLTTHLAESREEMSMFCDGSGPLYEFMKTIGRDMSDCGRGTPLQKFFGRPGGASLPSEWIVAHLNELTESDFELLEGTTERFHVVHSPRSHGYFGHSQFPFKKLHALGFNICLGTDSLASNQNLSLFAEMRAFQGAEPGILPDQILEMVTVNAASALHQENALGRIRTGFCADLISIPCSGDGNIFDQIIAFEGPVDWMMVTGKM